MRLNDRPRRMSRGKRKEGKVERLKKVAGT